MARPLSLAGGRSIVDMRGYLMAWADTMHQFDARMQRLVNAYGSAVKVDFDAMLADASVTGIDGQSYVDVVAKFKMIVGAQAYKDLLMLADQLGDLNRS